MDEAVSPTRAAPMTRKDLTTMIAPEGLYPTGRQAIWVLFDVRDDSAVRNLHLLRGALQEFGDLEFIDQDHAVVMARPGGAERLKA
jgi:hypothetical protein